MTRIDSRIEEGIARIPGLGWFDSRKSGDVVGYLHKVIWVALFCSVAYLTSQPAWHGGVVYLCIYVPLKIHGLIEAFRDWESGASRVGPLRDYTDPPKPGINFGFVVDSILDLVVVIGCILLVKWRIG